MSSAEITRPARSWPRLDGVDLLRGLAIFLVLMNHVNMRLRGVHVPYTRGMPEQLVDSLVWNGQQGVQIFFAVSGFLITSTALRRWNSLGRVNLREFYQLRFARIAPLLLLLLATLSGLHLARVPGFIVAQQAGGLSRALLAALTFHVNVLEATRGYLPVSWDILWSLSVEEMFYLFFPLVCVLFRRVRFLLIPLLFFVVMGPIARSDTLNANPVWREYSYLGGMDAIAMGCMTAIFVASRTLSKGILRAFGALGIALLVFCLACSTLLAKWGLERTGLAMSILAVGACMAIVAAAQSQWQAPRFFKPLLGLGQRSYEVYLTHGFVVLALFSLFVAAGKPLVAVPVLFAIVIVLAGLLGLLVAHMYSEPANRWLRNRWNDAPGRLGSVVEARGALKRAQGASGYEE
jgi:peptidoglycan/LPS O-acetylase OafA/YrhL